jgi:hypothetical protein
MQLLNGTYFHGYERSANISFRMKSILCGGGVEYLHRSPDSRRMRRKGSSVSGGITGPPCSWGILIRGATPPGWGSLESVTEKRGREPLWTRTWDDCAGEDQQQLNKTDLSHRQRRCYARTMKTSVQSKKKNVGLEFQGACLQDEMIGGKPSVLQ